MADIVDAAQKQINDAAQKIAPGSTPPAPATQSTNTKQLKEEALLAQTKKEEENPETLNPSMPQTPVGDSSLSSRSITSPPHPPAPDKQSTTPEPVAQRATDPDTVTSIMESVLSTNSKRAEDKINNPKDNALKDTDTEQVVIPVGLDVPSQSTQEVTEESRDNGNPDLTPTILPPPNQPKRSRAGPILAVLLFLFLMIPLGVYFASQQRQLADLRSRAVGPYPTPTPLGGCSGPLQSCESTPCCSGPSFRS